MERVSELDPFFRRPVRRSPRFHRFEDGIATNLVPPSAGNDPLHVTTPEDLAKIVPLSKAARSSQFALGRQSLATILGAYFSPPIASGSLSAAIGFPVPQITLVPQMMLNPLVAGTPNHAGTPKNAAIRDQAGTPDHVGAPDDIRAPNHAQALRVAEIERNSRATTNLLSVTAAEAGCLIGVC